MKRLIRQTQAHVLVASLLIPIATIMGTGATAIQRPDEIVVEGGMQRPSATDLTRFFANIDVAFVGIAQRVTVQFFGEDHSHPYTRMTFRPTEILKGATLSSYGDIDVWTYGGSYIDLPSGRQTLNPAGIARGILPGAVYFVPTTHIDVPELDGKRVLAADDALVQIDGSQVRALYFFKTWLNAVVANRRALFVSPGVPGDDAFLFLSALRAAPRH
jgi:hypothetical protein